MKRRNLLFPLLITAMGWGSCAKNDPGNIKRIACCPPGCRSDLSRNCVGNQSADAATFTLEICKTKR
ncbi:MAG: hypothetical protein ACLUEV_05100 [Alistipes sp.]